jgi:uroporphyrinogen decarboxylase
MKMNSRERVKAVFERRLPDRVPYCELYIDQAFAAGLDIFGPAGREALLKAKKLGAAEAKAVSRRLGLDNIFFPLLQPNYCEMHVGKDGRSFPGAGLIKTEADLAMVKLPDPADDGLYAEAAAFAREKGEFAAFFVTRSGLAPTMLSLGIDGFALALYDNRPLVEKLFDIYFDWSYAVAERASRLGFDVYCTNDDFAFKTGMMFSPKMFRSMLLPRYKKLREKIGLPWVVHSDGNIYEALEIFAEAGVDGVHPCENAAMDIRAAKKNFGEKLCILGNVDMDLLGAGSPAQVDAEVRGLIRDLAPSGGYIVTSGNSLASYLKTDNVLAMSAAVQKYGGYPITP